MFSDKATVICVKTFLIDVRRKGELIFMSSNSTCHGARGFVFYFTNLHNNSVK